MWWKCQYLLFFFSEATFNTNGCILDPFFSLSMVQALVFFLSELVVFNTNSNQH